MIVNVQSSEPGRHAKRQTRACCRFFKKLLNDWSFGFASMLAYNTIVSLLPVTILILALIGFILEHHEEAQQNLKNVIIDAFPQNNITRAGVRQLIDLAFDQLYTDAKGLIVIGLLVALIASSRLFVAIDKCMTIIYRLPERTFLRRMLLSVGFFLLFILFLILILAANAVPAALIDSDRELEKRLVYIGGTILSLLITFVLFEIIYMLIPNKKMSLKKTWCGSLFSAVVLQVFSMLFPLYVRYFMSNYTGRIGFVVILTLFFFIFAFILILGAQINSFFFENHEAFDEPLGMYMSKIPEQHTDANHADQVLDGNNANRCISKICFCKRGEAVYPQPEDNYQF